MIRRMRMEEKQEWAASRNALWAHAIAIFSAGKRGL